MFLNEFVIIYLDNDEFSSTEWILLNFEQFLNIIFNANVLLFEITVSIYYLCVREKDSVKVLHRITL